MVQEEARIPIHRPNPSEMLFFFLCGVVTSVPLTIFIAQFADSLLVGYSLFYTQLISTALFAPLIEEFSKIFPLFYRHGETQRSVFNLALLVGLGFGLVEMLTYVFVIGVPIQVRLPGLLFHPASTAISAYGIATKKPLLFYGIAVALHFASNFLAVTNPFQPISASILIVGITVFVAWYLRNRTREKIIMYR